MNVLAALPPDDTRITPLGPILREAEREAGRRIKDKSYRRTEIGQQVGRWLRALRWADASPAR